MNWSLFLAATMGLSVTTGTAIAQDFETGLDAYVASDYATALKEWLPLAESGNVDAQYNIGMMYRYGEGVPQDPEAAAGWLRLAAEQGNSMAALMLGRVYSGGPGALDDNRLAYMWFDMAGFLGNSLGLPARDEVAATMNPEEIAEANRLSQACRESSLQECGN